MRFNRICVKAESSIMNSAIVSCYEHEVPILQAIFGGRNITPVEAPEGYATGPAEERDLVDEWERLMDKPRMVQTGKDSQQAAPLVAFPRGVLDLEDFYERLSRGLSKQPAKPPVEKETQKTMPGAISPKEQRAAVKTRLDRLGIEYKGNASTESLLELLEEVDQAPPNEEVDDANVSDEGRPTV
jgi:hypothetical protein